MNCLVVGALNVPCAGVVQLQVHRGRWRVITRGEGTASISAGALCLVTAAALEDVCTSDTFICCLLQT